MIDRNILEHLNLRPNDEHNRTLVDNVHPPAWRTPEPADRYNLVVIGAGTAGLISAVGAASLGARVALVERHLMGGDCLNVGCVPSKALIRAARAAWDVRNAGVFGVKVPPGAEADFPAVMERLRRLRARISFHDSARRFADLGVDVFIGNGEFLGPDAVRVNGTTLRFSKAVIAAGARAAAPDLPGLREAGYLTNETVFNLTELPRRLIVIGAGPIGCELAQAFARFGSRVTLLQRSGRILPKEDPDISEKLLGAFRQDGVDVRLACQVIKAEKRAADKIIHIESNGKKEEIPADEILIGTGRAPNVEGLGLDAAGVDYDSKTGVHVNDLLRTTNPKIYAAGDVCSPYKFTHMAEAFASLVIQNALFPFRKKVSALTIPWCTYTDPEVAHVGLSAGEAKVRGIETDTFEHAFEEVDRAVLDGEDGGLVRVLVKKGTDKILGATIVARHAGEMISEVTVAMVNNLGLRAIGAAIHPYPTQAEAIKRLSGHYLRSKLTPALKRVMRGWMAWQRRFH
jgi:pyruvate/2-oxoglutarate dehydrogenase complex dihydrolipoamide dehydrogenase (E3) component